ncbi:MAG: hypothetical protein ACOWWO_03120 [Peptococcaceae bacterium]
MNECMNIYELIQKELDGELTPAELQLLEDHCTHCFTCRLMRKEFTQTISGLTDLPFLDPGEKFLAKVLDEVHKEPLQQTKKISAHFTGLVAGLFLLFSSGIVIVGSVTFSLLIGGLIYYKFDHLLPSVNHLLIKGGEYLYFPFAMLKNTFGYALSPGLLISLLLISMLSFIILVMLIYSRRTIRYEN